MISLKTKPTRLITKVIKNLSYVGYKCSNDADSVIGHNIIGYDNPVITKLYPWFTACCLLILFFLSRLVSSGHDVKIDKKHNWKHMPLKLYGRHSLESYGYRLNEFTKVRLAQTLIGKSGLKRWNSTAYKT